MIRMLKRMQDVQGLSGRSVNGKERCSPINNVAALREERDKVMRQETLGPRNLSIWPHLFINQASALQ
jgi:hypothetical protein